MPYNQSNLHRLEETTISILVKFFSVFHGTPSSTKPIMTPVSFVKTTKSYGVSLVTINLQTLYESGILRQDYGFIRNLPMDHTRFADWVTIWVVHLLKRTEMGGPNYRIGLTVGGMHSCNGWFNQSQTHKPSRAVQ